MPTWPLPQPAVKVAIAILTEAMDPVLVSARMPKTRPLQFVRVDRVGGSMPTPVTDISRLLVECFASDMATAEDMTAQARQALRNAGGSIVAGAFVRGWTGEQGPVSFDDPTVTDQRRWQFTGDLLISTRDLAGS